MCLYVWMQICTCIEMCISVCVGGDRHSMLAFCYSNKYMRQTSLLKGFAGSQHWKLQCTVGWSYLSWACDEAVSTSWWESSVAKAAHFVATKKQKMRLKETKVPTSPSDCTPKTQRTLTRHHPWETLQPPNSIFLRMKPLRLSETQTTVPGYMQRTKVRIWRWLEP